MRKVNIQKLEKNIENRAKHDLEDNHINASSVMVKQDGKTVYKNHFGLADENSIFRMASMTKPITVAAVMILFDNGLINIDDPIEKYLPDFSELYIAEINSDNEVIKSEKLKNKPTIKHLLTHSSGILNGRSGEIYYSKMTKEQKSTLKDAVDYYSECALDFEPDSKYEYNPTVSFDILARIVEVISGEEYENYLKKNIFIPLNMKDTTFVPSDEQWKRIIKMHNRKDGKSVEGKTYEGCVFENIPVTHPLGGAGLISTLNDYANFAEMLLQNGEFCERRILSEKAVEMIGKVYSNEKLKPGREGWGLGVRVIVKENYKLPLGTYGWSGAYGTHFWIDKENKIIALYMKNSGYDGGAGAVTAENFELDVFNSLE